jgi:hypothetical protein
MTHGRIYQVDGLKNVGVKERFHYFPNKKYEEYEYPV